MVHKIEPQFERVTVALDYKFSCVQNDLIKPSIWIWVNYKVSHGASFKQLEILHGLRIAKVNLK